MTAVRVLRRSSFVRGLLEEPVIEPRDPATAVVFARRSPAFVGPLGVRRSPFPHWHVGPFQVPARPAGDVEIVVHTPFNGLFSHRPHGTKRTRSNQLGLGRVIVPPSSGATVSLVDRRPCISVCSSPHRISPRPQRAHAMTVVRRTHGSGTSRRPARPWGRLAGSPPRLFVGPHQSGARLQVHFRTLLHHGAASQGEAAPALRPVHIQRITEPVSLGHDLRFRR
jgi:hypothetical protein